MALNVTSSTRSVTGSDQGKRGGWGGGGKGEEEGINSSLLSVKLEIRKLLSSKAPHAVAFCP